MTPGEENAADRLQRLLATVLSWGTSIATALIASGLILALGAASGRRSWSAVGFSGVNAGIAMFILLPALRVVLMLVCFARERDYLFSVTAGLVLGMILFGFALNVALSSPG